MKTIKEPKAINPHPTPSVVHLKVVAFSFTASTSTGSSSLLL